jgi:hypothetical protein
VCSVNVTNFPILYSLFQDSHLYAPALSQGHSILTLTNKTFNSTQEGLDNFGDEIDFVMQYLGFLISVNDENSESVPFFLLGRV